MPSRANESQAADRYVVHYGHRDTGRSTSHRAGEPAHSFTDLTLDVLGAQDALGGERARLVCRSMFGGTGLSLGVDHPDRVVSLTSVPSSTGADDLPPPSGDLTLPAEPDTCDDTIAVIEYVVDGARAYAGGSTGLPERIRRHRGADARDPCRPRPGPAAVAR